MSKFIRNEPFEATKDGIIISTKHAIKVQNVQLQLTDLKGESFSWETQHLYSSQLEFYLYIPCNVRLPSKKHII